MERSGRDSIPHLKPRATAGIPANPRLEDHREPTVRGARTPKRPAQPWLISGQRLRHTLDDLATVITLDDDPGHSAIDLHRFCVRLERFVGLLKGRQVAIVHLDDCVVTDSQRRCPHAWFRPALLAENHRQLLPTLDELVEMPVEHLLSLSVPIHFILPSRTTGGRAQQHGAPKSESVVRKARFHLGNPDWYFVRLRRRMVGARGERSGRFHVGFRRGKGGIATVDWQYRARIA